MSTANTPAKARHISELLSQLFQETDDPNPDADAVRRHANQHGLTPQEVDSLNDWQHARDEGRNETMVCTTCWAVSVTAPDSEYGMALSTCDICYRTVCEFCHQHTPADDLCRCRDCADQVRPRHHTALAA